MILTLDKLEATLDQIIHTTIMLDLICHLAKTSAPSQCVKYCGFIYNTSSVPTLHIPSSKISQDIALVNFLQPVIKVSFSRLGVIMVVGFLQSLVPAAPGNTGASFLRSLCEDIYKITTSSFDNS